MCHLPVVSRCWGMLHHHSPDISVHEPLRSAVVEEDDMDTGGGTTDTSAPNIPLRRGLDNSHGHMRIGKWAVIRPYSSLLRNSLAGSPGVMGPAG